MPEYFTIEHILKFLVLSFFFNCSCSPVDIVDGLDSGAFSSDEYSEYREIHIDNRTDWPVYVWLFVVGNCKGSSSGPLEVEPGDRETFSEGADGCRYIGGQDNSDVEVEVSFSKDEKYSRVRMENDRSEIVCEDLKCADKVMAVRQKKEIAIKVINESDADIFGKLILVDDDDVDKCDFSKSELQQVATNTTLYFRDFIECIFQEERSRKEIENMLYWVISPSSDILNDEQYGDAKKIRLKYNEILCGPSECEGKITNLD